MIEAGAKNRRWPAVIFGSSQHANRVRLGGLVLAGVALDLPIDPAAPSRQREGRRKQQKKRDAEPRTGTLRLLQLTRSFRRALHPHYLTFGAIVAGPSRFRGWEWRPRAKSPSAPGPATERRWW